MVPPLGEIDPGLYHYLFTTTWKYGERAFRYCQHDAGHAIATMRYAVGALGWRARCLDPTS